MNKKLLIISLIASLTLVIAGCNSGGGGSSGVGANNSQQKLKVESKVQGDLLTQSANVKGVGQGLFDLISGYIANKALDGIWGGAVAWLGLDTTTPDPQISQILNIVQSIQTQISSQTNLIWQAYQAQTGAFEGQAAVNMAAYFQNINLLWLNVQSSGMTPTQTSAWVNGGFTSQMEQQLFESSGQDIYDDLISSIQNVTNNVYYISGTNSDTMGPDLTTPLELLLLAGIQNAQSNYMVLNPNLSTVRKAMDDNSDTNSTENTPTNNAFAALYNFYQFVTGLNGQVTQYLVQAYQVEQLGIDLYYSGYLSQSQQQELQAAIGPDLNINLSQTANIANLQTKYETFAKNTNSLVASAILSLYLDGSFNTIPGSWADSCGNNVSVDDFLSINAIAGLDPTKFIPSNGNPPTYYYDGSNTLRTLCKNAQKNEVVARYSTGFCGIGNSVMNSNGRLTCSNPNNMNQNAVSIQQNYGYLMYVDSCIDSNGFNINLSGNNSSLNLVPGGVLQQNGNSISGNQNVCGGNYNTFVSSQIGNNTGYDFAIVTILQPSPTTPINTFNVSCIEHDLSCSIGPGTLDQSSSISYSDGSSISLVGAYNDPNPNDGMLQMSN